MPNTANYSFPTPADTDLVKNGADAIRDLGDAVDTAMNTALGTKKAGMVLLNTTSFSAVSSVSLPADTFTTTYKRYRVMIKCTSSAGADIDFRLRAAGTDATGTDYKAQTLEANNTTVSASRTSLNRWYVAGGYVGTTGESTSIFEVVNPAQTVKTQALTISSNDGLNAANIRVYLQASFHDVAASYDSGTIIPGSGTISGSVSVYAFNE
jgi:hypothetical protein